MAQKRPYEDLLDTELITTWRKRDDEYTEFYMIPRLSGQLIDFTKSQLFAAKIDRLEEELIFRKLFSQYRIPTNEFYKLEK